MKILALIGLCLMLGPWVASSSDMNRMEHGPFVSWSIATSPVTAKAVAVKLSSEPTATFTFDTDLLTVRAAWTGGFLQWFPQRDGLEKWPAPSGTSHFVNDPGPGWTSRGSFADPRSLPHGPLPRDWGRYHGLHVSGDKVLFSYAVGDCEMLELPSFHQVQNEPVFFRTLNLTQTERSLSLRLLRLPDGARILQPEWLPESTGSLRVRMGDEARWIGFRGIPRTARWQIVDDHLCLELPPLQKPLGFTLAIGPVLPAANIDFAANLVAHLRSAPAIPNLGELRRPAAARWLPVLETEAVTGSNEGAFAVDTLTLPKSNPWNSWIRLTGLDFLSDGRALVTSVSGDVWLIAGLGEKLGRLRWKRFAAGLSQPLGIKVVDGRIYVAGRDQITRLHDLNGDDEADFYENFNNDVMAADNFHEFTMNLETDSRGDFYFTKGTHWPPSIKGAPAPMTPHNGVLFKLARDGTKLETIATGLRYPNGLAISPADEIVFSDNQGNWVPTSVVHSARPGRFYGFLPSAHRTEMPQEFEKPITWLPHTVDNSPGSPIWVTSDQWGPLKGKLLLTSYGKATLSLMLTEKVEGQLQGGFLNLPLRFESGLIRGRFHRDGNLYLVGMKSWQSAGIAFGAFHRVRYTGQPWNLPLELNIKPNGLQLRFSCELDPATATDEQNYGVEQWNYRWVERYGSPQYSVKNPDLEGHDKLEIRAIRHSDDKKSVFLEIPGIQPVMQMQIAYILKAADGTDLRHKIYNTIHRVPSEAGR